MKRLQGNKQGNKLIRDNSGFKRNQRKVKSFLGQFGQKTLESCSEGLAFCGLEKIN